MAYKFAARWFYVQGAVWLNPKGDGVAVAMRGTPSPTLPLSQCIGGHAADMNMKLAALAPTMLKLADAVEDSFPDDLSLFTDEQRKAIELARSIMERVRAF